jgi:hypothetical protein
VAGGNWPEGRLHNHIERQRAGFTMQAEIDSAAGIIWRYLNEHGEMTLSKLKQGTRLAAPLLLMGIGWLSREEKLSFTKAGRIVRVSLREHQTV